jgi:hypothetical protein
MRGTTKILGRLYRALLYITIYPRLMESQQKLNVVDRVYCNSQTSNNQEPYTFARQDTLYRTRLLRLQG